MRDNPKPESSLFEKMRKSDDCEQILLRLAGARMVNEHECCSAFAANEQPGLAAMPLS